MERGARAYVVADLGFGDAGKGTITDALVRRHGARLVVRWNGGAQAGHTVVTDDGRTHTFSQLGAGSFVPGVRTHLSERVVVHPTGLVVEAEHLARSGVTDGLSRVSIAASALVTTPFHQAAGRLRELARREGHHGTCGVGVGETVRDALESGEPIRAGDLAGPGLLRRLDRVRERLLAGVPEVGVEGDDERAILESAEVAARWCERLRPMLGTVVADDAVDRALAAGSVVLEGAQGVLLDERYGFHPHTTWSDCTPAAATAWLSAHGVTTDVVRLGVTRTYATRHGAGPFPTEDRTFVRDEPHNPSGGWQGRFRVGPLDLVLLRYAVEVSGGLDALAVTHCDRTPSAWATDWDGANDPALFRRAAHLRLVPGELAHQEQLGLALRTVRPRTEPIESSALPGAIAHALQLPLAIRSSGPRSSDKQFL